MPNSLQPDQARRFVGPDLDLNFFLKTTMTGVALISTSLYALSINPENIFCGTMFTNNEPKSFGGSSTVIRVVITIIIAS